MEGIGSRGGGRLVLVPLPYQGHLTPMLQLGTILHSKGFSVTVVHTPFNSPNPSTYPDFDFIPIPDGLSTHEATSGDFVSVIMSLNVNCVAYLQQYLMMESQNEIVCVIYDSLMYFAQAVAKHLKLPSIVLRPSSAFNVLTYDIYPRLQEAGHIPIQESKAMDIVPGLHPIRYMDLPIHNFYNIEAYLQIVSKVSNIGSSSAVIWNTVDCLEQSALAQLHQQYQVPIFSVGPLHKFAEASSSTSSSLIKEDTSCLSWLDKHPKNSVIYVSLGSIAEAEGKELTEMAWGLANSKQPFLWVIRSEYVELLPKGYTDMVGERGCIVKWAPQRKVLKHNAVGGFWSHCGWNSTMESVSQGVPMICRPCFADQRVNARYLSQVWKVGLQLEGELERGEIERSVTALMVGEEGSIMREKAMCFKKMFEIAMGEAGSSHTSLCQMVDFLKSSVSPHQICP